MIFYKFFHNFTNYQTNRPKDSGLSSLIFAEESGF